MIFYKCLTKITSVKAFRWKWCFTWLSLNWFLKVDGKRTEKSAKIQIKNSMLLVSRQNLDYRRYWLHYFLILNYSFYQKGYVTICDHLSFYFIYYFSKYLYENYSKTENSPEAKEKKSGEGVKLKFIYTKVILEMFLNLQFLQNN